MDPAPFTAKNLRRNAPYFQRDSDPLLWDSERYRDIPTVETITYQLAARIICWPTIQPRGDCWRMAQIYSRKCAIVSSRAMRYKPYHRSAWTCRFAGILTLQVKSDK